MGLPPGSRQREKQPLEAIPMQFPSRTPFPLTAVALVLAGVLAGCESGTAPTGADPAALATPDAVAASRGGPSFPATPTLYATGLAFPRGLKFGPDGDLYVAEAGSGGSGFTTAAQCAQVPSVPGPGPYTNGPTGRISRVDRHGGLHTVASGFPSAENAFQDVLGVADVAFVGNTLYALSSGGGCSHGVIGSPAGIARVSRSGSWSIVADLSAYQATHPVAHPNPADFEPDGSWYGMIENEGALVAVEPNHGEVVHVDPRRGAVSRIVDISASQGHVVPSVVAARRGALYVSGLGVFPIVPGAENIYRVSRSCAISVVANGFTTVLGLVFDHSGRLYVLESSPAAGFPTPFTGRVVRLDRSGTRTVIVNGLFLPTGMTIGPDGALYISNKGYGPPQPGEILRVQLKDDGRDSDDMEGDRG
jgi:hypothetical protein